MRKIGTTTLLIPVPRPVRRHLPEWFKVDSYGYTADVMRTDEGVIHLVDPFTKERLASLNGFDSVIQEVEFEFQEFAHPRLGEV